MVTSNRKDFIVVNSLRGTEEGYDFTTFDLEVNIRVAATSTKLDS